MSFYDNDRIRKKNLKYNTPEALAVFYRNSSKKRETKEEFRLVVEGDKTKITEIVETLTEGGFKVTLEDFKTIRLMK